MQPVHYSPCLYGGVGGYDGWTSSGRHAQSAPQSYVDVDFLRLKRSRTGTGNSYDDVHEAAAMLERRRRCVKQPEVVSAQSRYADDVMSSVYESDSAVVQSGAVIARRNERERNRVKTINQTFARLRQHLPSSAAASVVRMQHTGGTQQVSPVTKVKKLSKVQILRAAIHYIGQLQQLLTTNSDDDAAADDDDNSNGVITDARYSYRC